ncbi:pentapeptide repeat-containing protein [Plantactinospora sp. BB1]|uniref:pentapeptide repeat-containing protein n=1 Tax=Plantactinospora sp. BB1 TaxID=2071627 RepID=UPI000D1525D8|nr:pentapeptide repeat-containing protein [Plantactinospora sp. BB1]AVT39631.1 hypothetical protein C6W10_27905 [Plantactinospora sp. BB1]
MVAALLTYAIAIWQAPDLLDQMLIRDPNIKPAEALTAQHNARLLVVSLGGALAVVIGLLYTARNYRLSHRGQVTDRFAKALERLGSDEMYVRIGGIHALEHLMRDSADHHADVLEVLVAFIRNRVPRARRDDPEWPFISGRPALPRETEADVQAALTAIGQRPDRPHRERQTVNLSGLHLQRAALMAAHLQGAILIEVDLRGAFLIEADLQAAHMHRAQLQGADMTYAQFQGAHMYRAQLQGADMRHAQFQRAGMNQAQFQAADMRYSRLQGAHISQAQFQGADLVGADLQGVYMPEAELQEANLAGANLPWAYMPRANLQGANLVGANLQAALLAEAELQEANLAGANLQEANLCGAQFCEPDGSRAALHLPDEALIDAYIDNTTVLPQYIRDRLERLRQPRDGGSDQSMSGREDRGAAP